MTAEPVRYREDMPDPRDILRELPVREHEAFLAIYREALDGARDLEGWDYLRRVLRAWRARAVAVKRPGFYEAEEAALNGTSDGGMLLADYIALRRAAGELPVAPRREGAPSDARAPGGCLRHVSEGAGPGLR